MKGFRIQTVAIEGFKGFTTRQVIEFKGRHAFLLGKNGNGKSSIVEAVRWGLFGSTGKRSEIIANRDYTGQCRVEISLVSDGKQWNLRRTVIRGVSGGNDAVLTDDQGKEHPIKEIMPILDSVDAGEGMHIIFAPQTGVLRRQPEDLSAFERTVFYHLGLTNPRSMLSQLDAFLEEHQLIEESLGKEISDVQDDVNRDIANLERQRGTILKAPPWESDHVPSVSETEAKIRKLITEITSESPDQSLDGVSLDTLIDSAEEAIENRCTQNQEELERKLKEITERKNRLQSLCEAKEAVASQESSITDTETQLKEALATSSVDTLKQTLNEARKAEDIAALKLRIVQDASSLVQRDHAESISCPICNEEYVRKDLASTLEITIGQLSHHSSVNIKEIEDRLRKAEGLEKEVKNLRSELANLEQKAIEARAVVDKEIEKGVLDQIDENDLQKILPLLIEQQEGLETSVQNQIDNQQSWAATSHARLSKLKEEVRFHKTQKSLTDLSPSRNKLNEVASAYQNLVSFGSTIQTIKNALESCLIEQLEKDIPSVSEVLSRVFTALTHHPWYDRLMIATDKLPKLELRVASSADTSDQGHSTEVLNGQAESALALVPYFAFSQAEDAPTEVLLVLLDDPTRAYDEDHIEILIEQLADLGKRVQLMVASQETIRLQVTIPKYFKRESYLIVEPTQWSHNDGPKLSVK